MVFKDSNFNKSPFINVDGYPCFSGWQEISNVLVKKIQELSPPKKIICAEIYPGALALGIRQMLKQHLQPDYIFQAKEAYKSEQQIKTMVTPDLGDDPVFGTLSHLKIDDYFDQEKLTSIQNNIKKIEAGIILIIGTGAVRLADADILIYADMARWEIQRRQRKNEISNLGVDNKNDSASLKYKWAFFVDWRVADRLKGELIDHLDFVIDTNDPSFPKMVTGEALRKGLQKATTRPFELVPYFDPGPWGGKWMQQVCDLDCSVDNYAWCFNCVPEENSLLLKFGETLFEIPAIDLVLYQPHQLLGEYVFSRFGAEFPIRFDFLDTWEGGNLSLQVHPTRSYIQKNFGWPYTQDESYYVMDAKPGAKVYLGLHDKVNKEKMFRALQTANESGDSFPADEYAMSWPVKKHDHILIPAGTLHCSGKESMVLEISSTPFIFTFKLWDWGRMGLNGKPRPVHLDHGRQVIQIDRTPEWTRKNLINRIENIAAGDGWHEERTGLHELEFIETRRHWFSKKTEHHTNGTVNVLNLVAGEEVIVESPDNKFEPVIIHYAETFIVPAAVGRYNIRPHGSSVGKECATIKAYVR